MSQGTLHTPSRPQKAARGKNARNSFAADVMSKPLRRQRPCTPRPCQERTLEAKMRATLSRRTCCQNGFVARDLAHALSATKAARGKDARNSFEDDVLSKRLRRQRPCTPLPGHTRPLKAKMRQRCTTDVQSKQLHRYHGREEVCVVSVLSHHLDRQRPCTRL